VTHFAGKTAHPEGKAAARPQAACPGVGPDLNDAGRDEGAGPAAGGEHLLSDRSADLAGAYSSDADAPKAVTRTASTEPANSTLYRHSHRSSTALETDGGAVTLTTTMHEGV
jgi:hypothetical protein